MPDPLKAALIRIFTGHQPRLIAGCGLLFSTRRFVTCAHVVNVALGMPQMTAVQPMDGLTLDFPFLKEVGPKLRAQVVSWSPAGSGRDIAELEILDGIPQEARPVELRPRDIIIDHPFRVIGYPEVDQMGRWVDGHLKDYNERDWIQMEADRQTGHFVRQGFSGTPVWDKYLGAVVGIVVAVDPPDTRTAYALPNRALLTVCQGQSASSGLEDETPLGRADWLLARGYAVDPFGQYAWVGEQDPVFKTWAAGLSQGIHPFANVPLVCTPHQEISLDESLDKLALRTEERRHFIFAPAGGGKTTLCSQLKYIADAERVGRFLSIVYSEFYAGYRIQQHLQNIVLNVGDAFRSKAAYAEFHPPDDPRPDKVLNSLAEQSEKLGYIGLGLFFDGIHTDRDLRSAEELITLSDDPGLAENIAFRFFVSADLRPRIQSRYLYGSFEIDWKKEGALRDLLRRRLNACRARSLEALKPIASLEQLCEDGSTMEDLWIEFCLRQAPPLPRHVIWLGDRLLARHFGAGDRRKLELLRVDDLHKAWFDLADFIG